jgi:hypothetical protein
MTGAETSSIETLVQAGAVGISIIMIAYSFAKDKMYNKTLNNHLAHFTAALDKNSEVIGGATEVMKNNCKIMERMEMRLDKS